MPSINKKSCWVVSDGRIGMENQALGLAEALARNIPLDISIKRISIGKPWSSMPGILWGDPFSRVASVTDENGNPAHLDSSQCPDIWVACGRRTIPLSIAMKNTTKTLVIQTQHPRAKLRHFDVVVPPEHDQLIGENVVSIHGAPNRLNQHQLSRDAEMLDEELGDLPKPRIAVLIGGDSKSHRMTDAIIKGTIQKLAKLREAGAGLMVTTSRRTSRRHEKLLRRKLAGDDVFFWDGEPVGDLQNPYQAMLGLADHIVVTNESTNMVTDAAYTGKPIHLIELDGHHRKFDLFHKTLEERSITRPFSLPLASWDYVPLRETDRAAGEILTRFPALIHSTENTAVNRLEPAALNSTYAEPNFSERSTAMSDKHAKVLIIGSGAAGYTAAIYAARAMLEPVLIQGLQPGGQLTITTDVENYPGFADVIQGPWLMDQMQKQAEHVGTEMISDLIVDVDFSVKPFRLIGDSGKSYTADSVIIATGAQAKWLGLPSEEHFMGFGVSACATCDGFFYRGKEVAVVGGGNTAIEEALFLTNFASKVTVIHRRDSLRAERILQNRALNHEKIEFIWETEVEEVLGETDPLGVTGLKLRNRTTDETSEISVHGLFVAIGHAPSTDVFKGKVGMKDNGYVITAPDSTATDIPGVFAAGDVTDEIFRQAVTAAGMGCMAALEAEKFLAE